MGPYVAALAAARTIAGANAIKSLGPGTDQATLNLLSGARTSVGAEAAGAALGASGKGGGGGGFFTGLLAAMGFGRGGGGGGRFGLGLLAGLPAIGTLGGLAGFSAEGVLGSLLGISGSIAGAGIGAGLLGLGAAGTGAVGMGTDMAGIGQAVSDVQKYRTALNSLNTAIATYGKNSTQAAVAQQHLNFVLAGMPAVARQAIVSLSTAISGFVTLFDKATGPAEKLGAQILTQAVHVGETFLPTIGMYAMQNMGIIRKSLQPFFTWLRTVGGHGGLGIFTNLEQVFQSHLPTGMHALEQGFELFAKTVTIASGYIGGFLKHVNAFLTRMNGATFGKWSHFVTDMIGLFNAWWPLVKAVGRTLFDLFKPAVGLGKQLAEFLTSLLGTFDKFLQRKGTQNLLHQLFTAHAGELIKGFGSVLTTLLPVLETFLLVWVQIEAAFRGGFLVALTAIADALKVIEKIPFGTKILAWGIAIGLLTSRLAPLGMWFVHFPGRVLGSIKAFASVTASIVRTTAKFVLMVARWVVGAAVFIAQNIAMAASATAAFIAENAATLGIIIGIAALVAAIIWMATHWHQVWGEVKRIAVDVWHFLYNLFHNHIVQDILAIWSVGLIPLAEHWHTVWNDIKRVVEDVWHAISPIFHDIAHAISDITGGISKVAGGIGHGIGDVLHFVGLAEGGIVHRPTLAVVGEAGPEMVIPFSRLGGAHITGGGVSPLPSLTGPAMGNHTEVHVNVLGDVRDPYALARETAWQVRHLSAA